MGRTVAHVDYVTDDSHGAVDGVSFLVEVLSEPANAALVGASLVAVLAGILGYLATRPAARDVAVLRETLSDYDDLVPWMLRLSLGLPLVGAGFAGYLFSPAVPVTARILQVALGFLLLFGLATRAVAVLGLCTYLVSLASYPDLLLAMEYVPGFVAVAMLGGGRPSADHILQRVADTPGSVYGRVDPVHRLANWFEGRVAPFEGYVPVVLRVGVGVTFVFLGLTQKLAAPGRSLAVVEKYALTNVVPVDPGLWVIGAGLVEMAVGVALMLGLFTRASAGVAFLMLTLTLFGLPDDPVLAHVTLFGMTSALVTVGSGTLSVDGLLTPEPADEPAGPNEDFASGSG